MAKDLTIRIRGDFGGDNSKLTKALNEIQAEIDEISDSFDAVAPAGSRALDTIGLGAENQIPRLQRMANSFQGLTGKLGQGLGAIQNIAKGMAPWNQALNLGGKAIRFLGDGLDAAEKKYPGHAKDIQALRSQFSGLKEDVMAAVGVMTVELLRPIRPLELLEQRVDSLRKKMGHRSFFGGDNERGSEFFGDDETWDKWAVGMSGRGTFDEATAHTFWNPIEKALDAHFEKTKKAKDKARQLADEQAQLAEMLRTQAAARAFLRTAAVGEGRNLDDARAPIGFSTKGLGESADSVMRDMFGRDAERGVLDQINRQHEQSFAEMTSREQRFRDSFSRRNDSYLSSLFGPIEEFNAYGTAFETLTIATSSAMSAWASGSLSLGAAIKKGIGDALVGVSSQMMVESAKHGAFALGSLAFGDLRGAGQHGAAAAAFGAGSIAAGAIARKLGGAGESASAGEGGRDHRGGGTSSSGRGRGDAVNAPGGSRGDTRRDIIYVVDDPFADMSPRQRALQIEKTMRRQGRRVHSEDQ